jgi:hypothetical protein
MTPHQILIVCLRLVALLWLLSVIRNLYLVFATLNADPSPYGAQVWLFAGLQVALLAVLWFLPATIAAKLLRAPRVPTEAPPPRLVEWQTLGVICIGLWALTRAVPDAVYWASFLKITSGAYPPLELEPDQKAGIVATAVEIVIAVSLLVGAKGITALLFKLRTAGIEK